MRTFPRAIELQEQAIYDIKQLVQDGETLKAKFVSINEEQLANKMLFYELCAKAVAAELRMWVLLKKDQPDEAWNALIDAQDNVGFARRFDDWADEQNLNKYLDLLKQIQLIVFPPQAFFSVGVSIKSSECSICESPYGDCEHMAGEVYSGTMCARKVTSADVREVSLVSDPVDRRCRVTSFTDDEGNTRDKMTWRIIKKD